MNTVDVLIVRIYITESSHLLNKIVRYLKTDAKIRGVSVFRAIGGFGESGDHAASLIDFSLDLPLTIEFFDEKDKINLALNHLSSMVKAEHIVVWKAEANC